MRYLLVIIATGFVAAARAQDVAPANWAAQPIKIDGKPVEWHQPLAYYDPETHLLFDISNDSANIYLCFESKDEQTQRKIMRAGMTVEISTKGRGRRTASIAFPLSPKERETQTGGANDVGPEDTKEAFTTNDSANQAERLNRRMDQKAMRDRFLTENITMYLQGFATGNGMEPINGRDITVAMAWDSASNLFYEIAIPIKQLNDAGYLAEELKKELTLNVAVNALPQKGGRGNSDNGGLGSQSGGFGGGGGGFGGGGGGFGGRGGNVHNFGGGGFRGYQDRSGLYKTTTFKQKFTLAGPDNK